MYPDNTPAEHLEWTKARVQEHVANRFIPKQAAITRFLADMAKHPDTKHHPQLAATKAKLMAKGLKTAEEINAEMDLYTIE